MFRSRSIATRSGFWLITLLVLLPSSARAQTFDPNFAAAVGVVELITLDMDGDARETSVWIVMIDGEVYLRTNETRWLENLRRIPLATLRVGDELHHVVAKIMLDPALVEQVDQASREKYGWQEKTIHIFRTSEPTIIRLRPSRKPGVIRDAGSPI